MSSLRRARRSLMRARWPVLAIVLLLGIGFAAVFGPEVAPHDPNRQNIVFRLKQPMQMDRRGQTTFVMGTDGLGRDVFSRLLYGARVSLIVGFVAMLVGGSIGTILGLIAGYCGGPVDRIIMSVADIQLAFPFILLAIMFLLVLGPGVVNLILALGIGQWVTYARIARAQTLSHREKEYVEAAKALGQGHVGILLTGILPNILAPLIIIASFNVASVILAEASLSFLGLGVPPTVPSWGGMLAESRDQLLAGRWWLAVFPGTAIMLTVLSFNILGDWLRDFLDPRLAVTLAVMVLIAAVAPAPAVAQVRGGTLTVGLPYDIDTLNVYATATLGDVESAVIEGLLAPNEHAHYEPVLATEVPTLANGGIELTQHGAAMRVTYHLRRGVTWHDGAPLTSADVKFTWEAVLDPHFLAESKDGTQDIESIDTPDESTVIVNYRTVAPAFASTLFTFGILPRHLLQGKDLNHDPYNDKPLGTGPFMVREFRRGQYVVLDRNPNYWGRDAAGASLPYLDRIVYKLIPSSNTLGALLRAGEVLLAPRIPFMLAKQLEGTANLELVAGPSLGWARLDFGMKGNSLLRDPVLRRAIAAAINRAALVKAAGGYPQPIRSPVLPVLDELYDPSPEAAVPGYDPVAANLALDAAGYRRDADGYRSRNGMPLAFGITTQAGEIDGEIAEQILIAELKAIGIRVAADNKTGIAYRQVRYKGEYDLLYGRWVTAADPVYSVFYGSHGPLNGQGYASAPLDAALARMESSLAAGPRRAASSEMQRIFAHDLPSIPLVNNVSIAAKSTRLKNFVINPTNMTDFIGVAHWYLEPLPAKMP